MEHCRYVSDSIGVCRLSERKCKASRAAVFNEPRRSATQWDSVPDSATVVYCIMLDMWSFAIQTRLAQQHIHKEPVKIFAIGSCSASKERGFNTRQWPLCHNWNLC